MILNPLVNGLFGTQHTSSHRNGKKCLSTVNPLTAVIQYIVNIQGLKRKLWDGPVYLEGNARGIREQRD